MKDALVCSIQQLCVSQGWTLSLAESCTGGHLAARLTRLPGCSQYFLGSVIAYSNLIKAKILGVDTHILETYGAVSRPAVNQMAIGVRLLSDSDYSLAISGIAGPLGGSQEKPVGTIWGAIASRKKDPFIWSFHLVGSRQEIIEQSIEIVLSQFWAFLNLI